MHVDVAIKDIHGKPVTYPLRLEKLDDAKIRLTLDVAFAGRNVDEEIPVQDFRTVAGTERVVYNDILGLIFESDGEHVTALIGIGSGSERFVASSESLRSALTELGF